MGKIIKHGIPYGGTSTIAGNISYNNSTSQLNSRTVQNAITELKTITDGATKQVNTLPVASSAVVGQIYQYTGTTTANYINGYFYKCINDNGTYKWTDIVVQEDNSNGYAWAGTQAEWNVLTSAQKAAYDGKEVLITDDSGSNEGVISSLEARIAELSGYATTTVNQLDQSNDLPTGTVTFVRYGNIVLAKGDLYFDVEGNHRQGVTTGSWKVCDIPAGFSASANFYYQIAPQCYQYTLNSGDEKLISYGIKGVYINLGAIVTGGQVVHSIDFSQIETDGGYPLKTTGYLSTHFYTSWYTDQPFPTNS